MLEGMHDDKIIKNNNRSMKILPSVNLLAHRRNLRK
jgi:hypothetical protein